MVRCLIVILAFSSFGSYAQKGCQQLKEIIDSGNLEQANEIISTIESKAPCNNLIGEVYLRIGRNDLAEEYFNKALSTSDSNPEEKANSLNNLGLVYWNAGNDYKAVEYITEALNIRKQIFTESNENIAASYNDLGLVSNNADIALKNYEKALKIYKGLQVSVQKIAQITTNIGIIYRALELYGDAQNNFNDALSIWRNNYPKGHANEGFVLLNMGQTYQKMGQGEEALLFYNKALKIYNQHYGNKHPDIAYTYNLIGQLHNKNGNFKEALANYQKALIANSPSFDKQNIENNPAANQYFNANTMLSTLYLKSQALEDFHYAFSRKFRDLNLSLDALQSCDTLIDIIRQVRTNEKDKLEVGTIAEQVYESGVRLCYDMAQVSIKKEAFFELSFYYAEKSKSAVLLEAISDVAAKSYADIPVEKLEEEKKLKAEINFYEQKLAANAESAEAPKFRAEVFSLKQQYTSFIQELEEKYPRYYDLKYNVRIPSIAELSSTLPANRAMICYFIADRYKRLYVYKITQSKFEVDNVSQTDDFNRYLSGFRNSIYFKDQDVYSLTAYQLYDILFPGKLNKDIDQLIIIPAGRLGTIPFEALLTNKIKDKSFNYTSPNYLINNYSISYQASSVLYFQQKKIKDTHRKALLCAPVKFNHLPNLPATGMEVKNLQAILSSKKIQSKIFLQDNANEGWIKSNSLTDYQYIHFATHGYVNQHSPALSKIILNETPDNDGNLYSGEIYNLNLNADLVTLSACETGLGKISKGEGIIGLSRAFTYAGAKNMVVSLWSVADNSTSSLMTGFYENIVNDEFSQPLRQAKLSMIKNEKYAHPYYWAPFILIGR